MWIPGALQFLRHALLASALGLATAAAAADTGRIQVVFADPGASYSSYHAKLERLTVAAGRSWLQHLDGAAAVVDLTVSIGFASMPTASGRSVTSGPAGSTADGRTLWSQGAAYELRTGIDPNGAAPDIEFLIGIDGYLQSELWFDPDPLQRSAAVPGHQTDAMTVLMHEFGHALGFNGWLDAASGAAPGRFLSTFDALVQPMATPQGTALFFTGAQAMAVHGGPVPLTLGSYTHLGNDVAGLGPDLVPDLMNGVVFDRGVRAGILALDLAMLSDTGLPVTLTAVPEPGVAMLLCVGVLPVLTVVWQRRRRALAPVCAQPRKARAPRRRPAPARLGRPGRGKRCG